MKPSSRYRCSFRGKPRTSCSLGFIFFIFCLPVCVSGQDLASITGTIRDASRAALPGVLVTATNQETGLSRRAISSRAGAYELLSLPVGRYSVTAEKAGFESVERAGLTLAVGEQITVNFLLRLGKVHERITVRGEPAMVSTSVRDNSGLVGERQVKELPLNGRSYDELMMLDPGVVNYTSEKTGGVGVSNSAVANMFAVSGRRPQENLFLLNGVEYTGEAEINLQPGGTSGQLLGVDAVREFNVLTNTYGAEYGKRPGAQVIIVRTLNSRTASTPSSCPLVPPGWRLISASPVYSTPFSRNRFSCGRRPDTANMFATAELETPTPPVFSLV